MKLIDGYKISQKIYSSLKIKPGPTLAVILIGRDKASHLYVSIKEKRAKELNINVKKYLLPTNTRQNKIIDLIAKLNSDELITAILVQLPLPKHLDSQKIISTISPLKDADGIHPTNLAKLQQGKKTNLLPATTGAILEAIKYTHVNLKNKSAAIIGKSTIVGLPTYYYLKNKVKKINIYDSKTEKLPTKTSQADILIVAIGKPKFITQEYIKPQSIIVDVGINKVNGKTVGDVDFDEVKNKTAWITPVPGGIGPITVGVLFQNVLALYNASH